MLLRFFIHQSNAESALAFFQFILLTVKWLLLAVILKPEVFPIFYYSNQIFITQLKNDSALSFFQIFIAQIKNDSALSFFQIFIAQLKTTVHCRFLTFLLLS